MANHPTRAPAHDETLAELIARRPERLNILVTGFQAGTPAGGWVVHLRYGYSPLGEPIDQRPVRAAVVARERWDNAALNQLGQPGAFVSAPDPQEVRAAIAAIRAAWGNLHVQDNSGLVPDLDQGKFLR